MGTRLPAYLMQDGRTRLDADYFNRIWADLDLRLSEVEAARVSWQQAVEELRAYGIVRIDGVLGPSIQASQEMVTTLSALAEDLDWLTRLGAALAPYEPSSGDTYAYDANGRLQSCSEVLPAGVRLTTFTYEDPSGRLESVTTLFAGSLRTEHFQYDANGQLTGRTVQEV